MARLEDTLARLIFRRDILVRFLGSSLTARLLSSFAGKVACAAAADESDPRDGIYSRAVEGTYTIPPELKNFWKKTSPLKLVNAAEIGFNPERWQGDTTRVIYHNGKYHCWVIDFSNGRSPGLTNDPSKDWSAYGPLVKDHSTALYMTSQDTYNWTAVGYVPLGRPGRYDDADRLQVNVFHHQGRFYMFYEGCTSNIKKYGQVRAGIGCLVADDPAGPWEYVSDDLILKAGNNGGKSFDSWIVTNPRHVHLNGKWYMYYKGLRGVGIPTKNGLAVAESITGPYTKYEGNPILNGHGHFCWRYKHGMLMIPHHDEWIHWSEDGIHFAPIFRDSEKIFRFGSLYIPNDPLFGEPVSTEIGTSFWGFDNPRVNPGETPIRLDVERMDWGFGETDAARR
jgi:hypothetical protein